MNIIGKYVSICLQVFFISLILAVSVFSQTPLLIEQENAQVNENSDYYFRFQTNIGDYAEINRGEIIITFPHGFFVTGLDSVEIIDDYKRINYNIRTIETDLQSLRLHLNRDKSIGSFDDDDDYPSDTTIVINVTVRLSKIQNPQQAGNYQVSLLGVRDNQKIAIGPLLSEPFTITSASIFSITVLPSENISLKAGTVQPFSASAFDQYGNKVEGTVFQWSLFDCSNCIGHFSDSSLFVTRVGGGFAQATAGGVSGLSEQITVTPGELSRMTLQVGDSQFVGNIINHNAAVILYDAYNNLKTDYDLLTNPIELVVSEGELSNYLLDNNAFQIGGVVRLKDFEVVYQGLSGKVNLYADNGMVSSNVEQVSFNNYDIIDVQNTIGETINSVFAGTLTTATFFVQNNGNLKADGPVAVTYYWKSRPDSLDRMVTMNVPDVGEISTVTVDLPALFDVGSTDVLVVSVDATYLSAGYTTLSVREFPIEVLDLARLSIVPESFHPDSILNHIPFNITFDVQADGFAQTIDSTNLSIIVKDKISRVVVAELYLGSPQYFSFIDGVIEYNNLESILNVDQNFDNGWYDIVMDYQLFSEGYMFILSDTLVDSIYVIFENGLSLVTGSLTPKAVYAGTNVSFEFELNLQSEIAYAFHGNLSTFRVFDNSSSSSTNLFLDTDSLYPGLNRLHSAVISIQPDQVGSDLYAEAKIMFCIPGVEDSLEYQISFPDPLMVLESPLLQIIDLEVIAPNAPFVNASQEIQFKASIVNNSTTAVDSVLLELMTIEGHSNIVNNLQATKNIQPFDTAYVLFDVIAAPTALSLPERFRVDIIDHSIGHDTPLNNSTFLIIEEPAQLEVNYRINGIENTSGYVVNHGEHIHLQFDMENRGTAKLTKGTYQFVVSGLDKNTSDTLTGDILVDSTIDFGFNMPLFDTTIQFEFIVTTLPIDINYNQPATIDFDTLTFTILTISNSAEIIIEPIILGSNLILPGRSKEILELSITNNSNSALNSIELEYLDLNIYTSSHNALDARDMLSVGNTYFLEGDKKITTTTAGGSMLKFWFTDFVVAAKETRVIKFVVEFKETTQKELLLEILYDDIKALYNEGPNAGQVVVIKSPNSDNHILSYQVILKGKSLEDSFIIENNPINPLLQPVQFTYELSDEASIEFQMFTLTGEEVYRTYYPAGNFGASIGENIIEWDGRNNSGEIVLNGVYIASILNKTTGEYARIKVAVVK